MVLKFPLPLFLKTFVFSAAFLSLTVTFINFWWKISLHSVGAGAIIGLVFVLSLKMLTPLDWYLISAILAGGLILSSRLQLNLHNPQQVWIGLSAGFFWIDSFYDAFLTSHLTPQSRGYCFVYLFLPA